MPSPFPCSPVIRMFVKENPDRKNKTKRVTTAVVSEVWSSQASGRLYQRNVESVPHNKSLRLKFHNNTE